MIKRTLFFTNPAYLSTKNNQLVVNYPDDDKPTKTVPIEDIGMLVLENQQITVTNGLISKLVKNKAAIINCDSFHLPISLLQPLIGHSEQTERIKHQLNASIPLKKNLWQQTISAKIYNQAQFLEEKNIPNRKMYKWATEVKSGDIENHESRAAVYYWQHILGIENFTRAQKEVAPNNLLNYGYAILRAITARALVSSGMLPSVGIFHHNKYNAFCLADDIMEPYRIYVDVLVDTIVASEENYEELTTQLKMSLLQLPTMDVVIDGNKSPLMVAMSRTTNSLYECFAGISRKILYPVYSFK
ncbi:type II CRISPR-associated endonuclease Cas1 [Urechidicola croceus]|uniref:CRISPR-associated endonuclease Cas1 n=1 Tax=Urechidicola croceus TaxID=1850246 RepID=A0A1D8P525_9FLAO|nr:type II CRISPR-associated endonuclease Cas1 [Urechidicola croceus]AOW19678.1 subtype II CRISPR-associated endonuclease Cas1 [Urechidicola croceus]